MAKANLGTKRVCPETGRKFYDLDKDPIVSPYTGNEYPLSFFEADTSAPKPDESKKEPAEETKTETPEEEELEVAATEDGPEIISLDDAEDDDVDDDADNDEEIPDIPDMPEVDIDDDDDSVDDDKFLEDDDDDDDLSDVIVAPVENEDDL